MAHGRHLKLVGKSQTQVSNVIDRVNKRTRVRLIVRIMSSKKCSFEAACSKFIRLEIKDA